MLPGTAMSHLKAHLGKDPLQAHLCGCWQDSILAAFWLKTVPCVLLQGTLQHGSPVHQSKQTREARVLEKWKPVLIMKSWNSVPAQSALLCHEEHVPRSSHTHRRGLHEGINARGRGRWEPCQKLPPHSLFSFGCSQITNSCRAADIMFTSTRGMLRAFIHLLSHSFDRHLLPTYCVQNIDCWSDKTE